MPEGYTQERTISFENDGTYKTKAVVTFERGSVYNRITLTGEGFKEDGDIMRKNFTFACPSSVIYVLPDKANNGIRSAFNKVCNVTDLALIPYTFLKSSFFEEYLSYTFSIIKTVEVSPEMYIITESSNIANLEW